MAEIAQVVQLESTPHSDLLDQLYEIFSKTPANRVMLLGYNHQILIDPSLRVIKRSSVAEVTSNDSEMVNQILAVLAHGSRYLTPYNRSELFQKAELLSTVIVPDTLLKQISTFISPDHFRAFLRKIAEMLEDDSLLELINGESFESDAAVETIVEAYPDLSAHYEEMLGYLQQYLAYNDHYSWGKVRRFLQ